MAKPSYNNNRAPHRTKNPRPTRANTAEVTPAAETTPVPEATTSYANIPDMAGPAHKADREKFLHERRLKPGKYQPVNHRAADSRVSKPTSIRAAKVLGYVEEVQSQMRKREWEALDARWANFAKRLAEHEIDLAEGREAYRRYLAGCGESGDGIDEGVRHVAGGTGPDSVLDDAGDKHDEEQGVKLSE